MSETSSRLKIIRPDDAHVHLRSGPLMKAVLPYTARTFARAVVMPNLASPLTTTGHVAAYRFEIQASLPKEAHFDPKMTLYLTDQTDPDDLERGVKEGILTAAKLYPAGATTNSAAGVSELQGLAIVLERMQRCGLPLLIHGEVTDPEIDIFDREAVFVEKYLAPLRKNFPELKIVLEHVTTEEGVSFVLSEGQNGRLGATITPQHLLLNRNDLLVGGVRPHSYCLPVLKREKHRQALVSAATSGAPMFFLGTDTAPHPRSKKECACGCAGVFSAMNALALYAQIFDRAGALDRLEDFASVNAATFYGWPINQGTITLEKTGTPVPALKPILTSDGAEIIPFEDKAPLYWRVVD